MLTRRTRISIETFHRGVECAPEAARLMGEVLGWSDATIEREVEHYARPSPPSATPRASPTTWRPTRPASAPEFAERGAR